MKGAHFGAGGLKDYFNERLKAGLSMAPRKMRDSAFVKKMEEKLKAIWYFSSGQVTIFNASSFACRSLLNILKHNDRRTRQKSARRFNPAKSQLETSVAGPQMLDVHKLIRDRIESRRLGKPRAYKDPSKWPTV